MDPKQKEILAIFEEINAIPRRSKNEEQISNWLVDWAKSHNFKVRQDTALNVIMNVPGTKGRENDPTVILQGHMDMVCEKTPDSPHDFSKDPIKHIIDDDWMHADKTTLGADNGIGIALSLAITIDESVSHPPLELLFTIDEETGLIGANSIENDSLTGKILLNLDSEDEGVFTIGCAGGRDVAIHCALHKDETDTPGSIYKLAVDGLRGGHSGVDIHEGRANANVLLGRLLENCIANIEELRLIDIAGGSAHNAIPRNAYAIVHVPEAGEDTLTDLFTRTASVLEDSVKQSDPDVTLSLSDVQEQKPSYTIEDTRKVVGLLNAMPHGVAKMSEDMEGLVETSNNFATIGIENDTLTILSSQRSSVEAQLDWIVSTIEDIAREAGAECDIKGGYPGWQPNPNSEILGICKKVFTDLFGNAPHIEAIHAGLECGIIGSKFENMDMISLGPTIKNPHSPDEKLFLPSVPKIWEFLVALLKVIK